MRIGEWRKASGTSTDPNDNVIQFTFSATHVRPSFLAAIAPLPHDTARTMPHVHRSLPFLLSLLVSGCSLFADYNPSPDELPVHTDRTTYVAQVNSDGTRPTFGLDVIARIENRTNRTVYLARCYPDSAQPLYSIELLDQEDSWGAAYNPIWGCVGHENPIRVGSGESRIDTLHLIGPRAWPTYSGQHFGVLEGRFRLKYPAYTCRDETGCALPDSLARSNVFEIRLAP